MNERIERLMKSLKDGDPTAVQPLLRYAERTTDLKLMAQVAHACDTNMFLWTDDADAWMQAMTAWIGGAARVNGVEFSAIVSDVVGEQQDGK